MRMIQPRVSLGFHHGGILESILRFGSVFNIVRCDPIKKARQDKEQDVKDAFHKEESIAHSNEADSGNVETNCSNTVVNDLTFSLLTA